MAISAHHGSGYRANTNQFLLHENLYRNKCMELGAAAVFNKLDGFKKAFEFLRGLLPRPDTQIEKVELCLHLVRQRGKKDRERQC
jgi:hypothetical protein